MRGAYESVESAARRRPHPRLSVSAQALLDEFGRERLSSMIAHSVRNDPEARTLIRRTQDYTVGTGPRMKAKSGDARFDKQIAKLWQDYTTKKDPIRIDIAGMKTLVGCMNAIISEWFTGGRVGAVMVTTGHAAGSIQLISSVRMRNPRSTQDDDTHTAGIEFLKDGPPTRFHVADWAHGGRYLSHNTSPVPAESFLYMPQPMDQEIDIYAPEPILGVGIRSIEQLNEFASATSAAGTVGATSPLVHTEAEDHDEAEVEQSGDGSQPGYGTDEQGNDELRIDKTSVGLIFRAKHGEALSSMRQEFPSGAVRPFIQMQLARISATMGVPAPILTGDWTGISFNGAKMVQAAYGVTRDRLFAGLVTDFLDPLYRFFVDFCIIHKLIRPPVGRETDVYEVEFRPPVLPEPDPAKAEQTWGFRLNRGMSTMQEYLEPKGRTPREHFAILAEERELAKEFGVVHPVDSDDTGKDDQIAEPKPGERELDGAGGGAPGEGKGGELVETGEGTR